jgi:hypothetical protein
MTRGTLSHVPDVHGRSAARLSVTVAFALLLRQGLDAHSRHERLDRHGAAELLSR